METSSVSGLWQAALPNEWPSPPSRMSFSRLVAIEQCPRRWALSTASYRNIWQGNGYPGKPRIAVLVGTIVHRSLERISSALLTRGCRSVAQPEAVDVLRQLGGYSRVIREVVDEVLHSLEDNPRANRMRDRIQRDIQSHTSSMRERVQTIISRLELHPRNVSQSLSTGTDRSRRPLALGSYSEIELVAEDIGWVGVADVLSLTDTGCEIIDFKTGAHRSEHVTQLQVYALLWASDSVQNPRQIPTTKLLLSYPNGDVVVPPPSQSDIDSLRDSLERRTKDAVRVVQTHPPVADPGPDKCCFCDVRQMCDAYWQWLAANASVPHVNAAGQTGDVGIIINQRQGPMSWIVTVEASNMVRKEQQALLLTRAEDPVLHPGGRLRIIDAFAAVSEEEPESAIITMPGPSEVFVL